MCRPTPTVPFSYSKLCQLMPVCRNLGGDFFFKDHVTFLKTKSFYLMRYQFSSCVWKSGLISYPMFDSHIKYRMFYAAKLLFCYILINHSEFFKGKSDARKIKIVDTLSICLLDLRKYSCWRKWTIWKNIGNGKRCRCTSSRRDSTAPTSSAATSGSTPWRPTSTTGPGLTRNSGFCSPSTRLMSPAGLPSRGRCPAGTPLLM